MDQAEIHRLALSQDVEDRLRASCSLGSALAKAPDKTWAWRNLLVLSRDRDFEVRRRAVENLVSVFKFNYSQKNQLAWQQLIELTRDEEDYESRWTAAELLGLVYQYVPDKQMAWQDLHELIHDSYRKGLEYHDYARPQAIYSLGLAFQYIPDKQLAWQDLHEFVYCDDEWVQWSVAEALVFAFQYIPDKELAWQDLDWLIGDEKTVVRMHAYHALGRISIFKATTAAEDTVFQHEIEKAIEFFERSSQEAVYQMSNPAKFCLPFYRSFYAIAFQDASSQEQVDRYLAEANAAVSGSKSKKLLLEAVENLSKALQEVRTYSLDDFVSKKRDLTAYTRYCFQAAKCLEDVREKAPLASKVVDAALVEKSIPIIDKRIKALFREVEAEAGRLCRSARGTPREAFGRSAYQITKGLEQVDSPIKAERYFEEIIPLLRDHCDILPQRAQARLKTLIQSMDTASMEEKFQILKSVLTASLVQKENDEIRGKEQEEIIDLFRNIEFRISRLSQSSGDVKGSLVHLQAEITSLTGKIDSQEQSLEDVGRALEEMDQASIERLDKRRDDLLREVEASARNQPRREDTEKILKSIQELKASKSRDALGILGDISSILGLAATVYGLLPH